MEVQDCDEYLLIVENDAIRKVTILRIHKKSRLDKWTFKLL